MCKDASMGLYKLHVVVHVPKDASLAGRKDLV